LSVKQKLQRVLVFLFIFLIIGLVLRNIAVGWTPSRDQYPVQGVTLSEANGPVQWHILGATHVDFAYLRASAGSEVRDARFAENLEAAGEAGIRRGAYHQYDLCRLANDQATNFVTTVPRDDNMLPPALFLSYSPDCDNRPGRALVLSEINIFLNQIEAHSGKPAVIAVSSEFENDYQISAGVNRTFWLIGNFFPPDYATKPWVMWQASDMLRISGVSGPVQWNVVRP
jgi:lysozyme